MSPATPNLAQDLIRIHKVITRGIDVSLIKGTQYLKSGGTNPHDLLGYSCFVHSLVAVLDSHHQSEDLIAFPELHSVLPSAPYARLTAEHHQVERFLALLRPAIKDLSGDVVQGLNVIVEITRKITTLWPQHYQLEEKNFSTEALNAVISLEDQQRISQATSKYSQDHAEPAYWIVPFVVFNLEAEDREIMISTMPPVIMEELVPKTWKEQWAPMQPLLLD
jgi:hemerythrin-like domain-containing protein